MAAGKTQIPPWAKNVISQPQIEKIEALIAEIEKKTDGEIVPMIVRRSMPMESSLVMASFFRVFLLLFAIYVFATFSPIQHPMDPVYEIAILLFLSIVLGVFVALSPFLLRLTLPARELTGSVELRAELEFYRARVHSAKGNVGILLFLSLAEHRAVVLADQAIAKQLSPTTWDSVIALLVEGARKKEISQGLENAIQECGRILSEHFPAKTRNENHLPNHLLIRE